MFLLNDQITNGFRVEFINALFKGIDNIFLLNDYIINNLFKGIDNILSSNIVNNLFLILIFSILLIILLFILVNHPQKGYSVKMNNLPNSNNGNSGSNNGNNFPSSNNGNNFPNSNNGNSGSNNGNSGSNNGNSGSNNGNSDFNWIEAQLFLNEADENSCLNHYKAKYKYLTIEKHIEFISTEQQIQDSFPSLYSEYKKSKVYNPELNWRKLTDLSFCTWEKRPLGCWRYAGNDIGYSEAYTYLERKKRAIDRAILYNKPLPNDPFRNTGSFWKQTLDDSNITTTTFKKYMDILENTTKR